MSTTLTPPSPKSTGLFKRILVGRRVASGRLEHTLLPKTLALPIFASDAMSSVVYAPEEILLALLTASAAAAALTIPIAGAVAILMVIVVASYKQIIKAYPGGGGAYTVSRDNLGITPGLVAAAALLVDYVLTVSVSIVAGVIAITSAVPGLLPYKVEISLLFLVFVMLVNLRGAKESGAFFAVPVYLFIVAVLTMIVIGVSKCTFDQCPDVAAQDLTPSPEVLKATEAITLFAILRAFSSGSAALTGVEAISNGVTAFKRPQAKNASRTLMMLAGLAIVMFMGIAFLAVNTHATISEERSVVAQVAYGVFGGGFGFYAVQVFSAAILILAANTSFQGLPMLAAILAKDRYLPRQFMNRGDRLVFSNGVMVLAFFAGLLIVVFHADLNALIQLYVVGVFTSFTLAQAGMVKHWLKEKEKGDEAEKGWRRSIIFNTIGAVTTFVVLIVVTVSKFTEGAWISILCMVILALTFPVINRHYVSVIKALRRGRVKISDRVVTNRVVLVVRDFDKSLAEAVGYIRSFHPPEFRAVWVGKGRTPADVQARWQEYCLAGGPELEILGRKGSLLRTLRTYVRGIQRDRPDFITVVVPEMVRERLSLYFLSHFGLIRMKSGLLREPNVVLTDVPVPADAMGGDGSDGKSLIPNRVVALLFVSAVNDATLWAVNYARTLQASEIRAIHFALDPAGSGAIIDEWAVHGSPVPLQLTEAPFRDLTGPMLAAVRSVTEREDTVAVVIVPEYIVKKRHRILHNQSALFVKRLFLSEPRTVLTSVPWTLEM